MYKIKLAKSKETEFEIELPFNDKKSFLKAKRNFRKEYFSSRCRYLHCHEFFLQFLSKKYTLNDILPNKRNTIDKYIKLYGKIEGAKKYKHWIKQNTKSKTLMGYIEKYGEDEGKRKYKTKNSNLSVGLESLRRRGFNEKAIKLIREKHKNNSDTSLNGLIKKYGEDEGKRKYEIRIQKSKTNSKRTLEYYLTRGATLKIAKEKLKKEQSRDKCFFLKKYGQELGENKYKKYVESKVVKFGKASKESLKIFLPLVQWLVFEKHIDQDNICLGYENCKEYFLWGNEKLFFYDLTIKNLNIIIEYNGSAFHPNKNILSDEEYLKWKSPFSKKSADVCKKQNLLKINTAKNKGFEVLIVWDNNTIEENLKLCKEFINNNLGGN